MRECESSFRGFREVEITDRRRNRVYEAPHIYQAVYGPLDPES